MVQYTIKGLPSGLKLPSELFGANGLYANWLRAMDPAAIIQQNIKLSKNLTEILLGTSSVAPDSKDWRFKDEAWTKNPFYQRLSQAYLALAEAIESMIPEDLEPEDKARAELAMAIASSTFSPTNTLAGNPAAFLRAIETRGGSLAKGLRNFVEDMLKNDGMPQQVDASKFKVGTNLAATPGKVVHRTEMFELVQYTPSQKKVFETPVLLVPPQIGRYYFTDLAPGRSFAEYVVSKGVNHFVISWRNPGREHSDWSMEDYAAAALEAAEAVSEITSSPRINLLGFCAGGILASLVAAHLAAKGRDLVNTLSLCVTMLDWESDASIGAFRLPAMLSVAKAQSEMKGILPGSDLHKIFTWLRPNDLVWNYWVNNYLMGDSPPSFDILAWNKDSTNLPAQLHSDFLEIFEKNPVVEPGRYEVLGTPVDLGAIDCDNFVVGAETDHLTPWKACFRSCAHLGGSSTFSLSNGGHIAALVNPPGNPKAYHFIGEAGDEALAEWQPKSKKVPGSWWESWVEWVGARSGELVAAPSTAGSKCHPVLASAPGTYVVQ